MERSATAFWITSPGAGELRQESLPNPGEGEALARSLHGAISRGTECLVYGGRVPDSQKAAMRAPFQVGDFPGPVNLGNPGEFTIRQLADLTKELTGSSSKIICGRPQPEDDPARRCPDISLAREKLHWQPTTALQDGLAKTIDWFKSIDFDSYRAPTPNY